jgi:biopolymer transport protein ExbD
MRRGSNQGDSKITLPITPMLDMTFQLLFFFLISFHPADAEGAVGMALPDGEAPFGLAPLPPGAAAPAMPSDLTVKVRAHLDGSISALSVRTAEGKENAVDGLAGLMKYLKAKRPGMKDGIRLQGDSRLKVRALIEVMDACRDAGFGKINFASPDTDR